MIKNYKCKKLELFAKGNKSKVDQRDSKKIAIILNALDTATCVDDTDLPGKDLHSFKERDPVVWSLKVSANQRITFSWEGDNIIDVDYLDTH